jgi:hypothetical protein
MGTTNFKLLGSILLLLEGIGGLIYGIYFLATTVLSAEQTKGAYWIIFLVSLQIIYFGIESWQHHKKPY